MGHRVPSPPSLVATPWIPAAPAGVDGDVGAAAEVGSTGDDGTEPLSPPPPPPGERRPPLAKLTEEPPKLDSRSVRFLELNKSFKWPTGCKFESIKLNKENAYKR